MTAYELTPRTLAGIGFSNHAIQRFADRAGLASSWRASVEPIIRDLVRQEGMLVDEPPRWARSRNTADYYLQIGDWMVFVLRPDRLYRGRYTAVTVVNGPAGNDWATALRRGHVYTPPAPVLDPLPSVRVRWHDVIGDVRAHRRSLGRRRSLLAELLQARAIRRRAAQDHLLDVQEANRRRSKHTTENEPGLASSTQSAWSARHARRHGPDGDHGGVGRAGRDRPADVEHVPAPQEARPRG